MVNDDHASILHVYGDKRLEKFWGHELDLLRSRDVIDHVTIRHGVDTFLLVVNDDHASILNLYGDTGLHRFWVTCLTFWVHVTSSVTWPSDSADVISYWWSIGTKRLSRTVTEILGPKIMGSRVWLFGVTWRHRWRDHRTRQMWFPIGSPLKPCVYLAPLQSYKCTKR